MRNGRYDWLNHVRDRVKDGTLDSRAGHVALALAVYYVNGGAEAWPSQAELAHTTGLSKPTVQRALQELEQHGLLTVRHGSPARTRGNVYRLATPS